METERGHWLWGLAHSITEAEKSHNLLSSSWRLRKAGEVQFKFKGPENDNKDNSLSPSLQLKTKERRGVGMVSVSPRVQIQQSWTPRFEGRRRWVCQLKERTHPSITCFIHLFIYCLCDCMMPVHMGEGGSSLLSLPIQGLNNVLSAIWASSHLKFTISLRHEWMNDVI
jgi:hypothetical protein